MAQDYYHVPRAGYSISCARGGLRYQDTAGSEMGEEMGEEMGGVRQGAGAWQGLAGACVAIDGLWIGEVSIWQRPGLWKKTMDQAIENRST